MPSTIRVVMQPEVERDELGVRVSSVELSLQRFGPGESKAALDDPRPAKLTFLGGYMDAARNKQGPETFEKIASLSGTLSLTRPGHKPMFELTSGATLEYEADFNPGKGVNIKLADSSFRGSTTLDGTPLRLRMPYPPETGRFFEFAVELEVDGSIESEHLVNDRLDMTLPSFIAVRLVDEANQPLAGEPFVIICPSGDRYEGETDERGIARVLGVDPGDAQVGVRKLQAPAEEPPADEPAPANQAPATEDAPEVAAGPTAAETTFVELRLVDEKGAPCAGEAFELITTSGETVTGTLDKEGYARVDGIDPGDCKVKFTNQPSVEPQAAAS